MFRGSATALVTPLDRYGDIDEEGLRQLVDLQEEGGIDAVVPCGTTGESATMTHEEHLQVISIVMDQVTKARVIAGAGSNSTAEAVSLSRGAQDIGADYLLSITPYYNRPTPLGLERHYTAIAEAVDVPVIVYNVPSRTGTNVDADTMLRLARIPGVDGVKEASGRMGQVMRILAERPEGFFVLSGEDPLTLPLIALGADGVVSVASNVMPELMSGMVSDALDGRMGDARAKHFELLPLFGALFLETNPIPVKTALSMMGKRVGPLRPPLCEMTDENRDRLSGVLADMGLIEVVR